MTDIREELRGAAAEVAETREAYEAALARRDRLILAALDYRIRTKDVIEDARFSVKSGRNRIEQIKRTARLHEAELRAANLEGQLPEASQP